MFDLELYACVVGTIEHHVKQSDTLLCAVELVSRLYWYVKMVHLSVTVKLTFKIKVNVTHIQQGSFPTTISIWCDLMKVGSFHQESVRGLSVLGRDADGQTDDAWCRAESTMAKIWATSEWDEPDKIHKRGDTFEISICRFVLHVNRKDGEKLMKWADCYLH